MTRLREISEDVADVQAIDGVEAILRDVCRLTGMRFAAVARVTSEQWVACQVLDRIEFGLNPGDELRISTTICDEIRRSGVAVVIDDVDADPAWASHRTPALYGFRSYLSLPIRLADGSFFGTLCAIDPDAREAKLADVILMIEAHAATIAAALDRHRSA